MKTTVLLLTFAAIILISCSKKDDNEFIPTLPAITQNGANTFGCYIDGQLFIPRDGTGTFAGPDRALIFLSSPPGFPEYNEINVRDFKTGNGGLMNIHIKDLDLLGEGLYTILDSNCEGGVDSNNNINIYCRLYDASTQQYKYYCSILNGGTLLISRYDFDNKIVSGTFNCTLQNRNNENEIIEITEGRFDLEWDELGTVIFP